MLVSDMYSAGGCYRFITCSATCHIMHYYNSYCLYPICQHQLLAPSICRQQVNLCWETASLVAFFQPCFGVSFMHPVMKVLLGCSGNQLPEYLCMRNFSQVSVVIRTTYFDVCFFF